MAYNGQAVPIPLGQLGLRTDDPMTSLPPNAAIRCNNISFSTSRLEKSKGSAKYNANTLGSPVVGGFDWFPTPTVQRMIVATADGKLWRDTGTGSFNSNTPIATGLGPLSSSTHLSAGGAEEAGSNRKLFIYTGNTQIKVLSGDATSVTDIATPALDWASSNFPTFGTIFQGHHVVTGCASAPHTIYFSTVNDHERFNSVTTTVTGDITTGSPVIQNVSSTTNINPGDTLSNVNFPAGTLVLSVDSAIQVTVDNNASGTAAATSLNFINGTPAETPIFTVFPGVGDGIVSMTNYKGLLMFFKRPFGAYFLEQNGSTDPANWSIKEMSNMFGIASPHAAIQVLDDLWAGNAQYGITSLEATNAFGDLKAGDILTRALVEEYIRLQVDPSGFPHMHAIYYNEKKRAYFTANASPGGPQNRIVILDMAKQVPRVSIETKDQPNFLALRKDTTGVQRPWYGANDGFVYLMEQATYNVGNQPYTAEFQTPFIDFSYLDGSLASRNKIFDFLEIQYIATGAWPFYVDVYVDNHFVTTVTYQQQGLGVLDSFILDTDQLSSEFTQKQRRPTPGCTGQRISFRIYNNALNQYFKVERIVVNFRISGEQEKSVSGVFKL